MFKMIYRLGTRIKNWFTRFFERDESLASKEVYGEGVPASFPILNVILDGIKNKFTRLKKQAEIEREVEFDHFFEKKIAPLLEEEWKSKAEMAMFQAEIGVLSGLPFCGERLFLLDGRKALLQEELLFWSGQLKKASPGVNLNPDQMRAALFSKLIAQGHQLVDDYMGFLEEKRYGFDGSQMVELFSKKLSSKERAMLLNEDAYGHMVNRYQSSLNHEIPTSDEQLPTLRNRHEIEHRLRAIQHKMKQLAAQANMKMKPKNEQDFQEMKSANDFLKHENYNIKLQLAEAFAKTKNDLLLDYKDFLKSQGYVVRDGQRIELFSKEGKLINWQVYEELVATYAREVDRHIPERMKAPLSVNGALDRLGHLQVEFNKKCAEHERLIATRSNQVKLKMNELDGQLMAKEDRLDEEQRKQINAAEKTTLFQYLRRGWNYISTLFSSLGERRAKQLAVKTFYGYTLLHAAAQKKDSTSGIILYQFGALLNAKSPSGNSATDYAMQNGAEGGFFSKIKRVLMDKSSPQFQKTEKKSVFSRYSRS